ncbi:MAG: hypothetical protein U0736_04180 [Gemmataceae bacterium]
MARTSRLPLLLTAGLALVIAACRQTPPTAYLPLPPPPPQVRGVPASPLPTPNWDNHPVPIARLAPQQPPRSPRPAAQPVRPVVQPVSGSNGLPGDRVAWVEAPRLRAAPTGVTPFLADVESRLPPSSGMQYRDKSRVTWCHETTHGVHAALRIRHGKPAFYVGDGRCALVDSLPLTLTEIAAAVPPQFRGGRFQVYLVSQRKDWDREPLYVWDEWVAYNNGTTTGIEEGGRAGVRVADDAVACLEMSGYALAVAAAARRKGVPLNDSFREFLACELRRSLGLYARAITLPAFAWHDRRLERVWRDGDPFIVDELRALYGESLTVGHLLP